MMTNLPPRPSPLDGVLTSLNRPNPMVERQAAFFGLTTEEYQCRMTLAYSVAEANYEFMLALWAKARAAFLLHHIHENPRAPKYERFLRQALADLGLAQ
jgi:hypothetical protein